MKLTEYLDGMREASTADELEAAIRAPFEHSYQGRTWARIRKVVLEAGVRICDAHPNGHFVPRYGPKRHLTVCGESYRVGKGGNSTGVRYAWTNAEHWATGVLRANGFGKRAAHEVWEWALSYPHRALQKVEAALAGELPDPTFDVLIDTTSSFGTGESVRVNRDTEADGRAHRSCPCGGCEGWLWDWGAGHNGYANFINWRCDSCPRTFTEYLSDGRLYEIRNPKAAA